MCARDPRSPIRGNGSISWLNRSGITDPNDAMASFQEEDPRAFLRRRDPTNGHAAGTLCDKVCDPEARDSEIGDAGEEIRFSVGHEVSCHSLWKLRCRWFFRHKSVR